VWDSAWKKIERRTPYISEWGDGKSVAHTAEEAQDIWQKVKKEENHNTQNVTVKHHHSTDCKIQGLQQRLSFEKPCDTDMKFSKFSAKSLRLIFSKSDTVTKPVVLSRNRLCALFGSAATDIQNHELT